MRVTLEPQFTKTAEIRAPSSKSLSHRALIAAALAEGTSFLRDIDMSKDIEATMSAMKAFGASFELSEEGITVHGGFREGEDNPRGIDCLESGSTLRFLIPIAALDETETLFRGHGRLMERPQSVYEKLFAQQNLLFEHTEEGLRVKGPLKAGSYTVEGNVSSQFISGLLFALPLLQEDSEITVVPPFESSAYVTLTVDALKKAGIEIEQDGLTFRIKGGQTYRSVNSRVSGDDSQAAFFAVLALLEGMEITVHGMDHDSHQPDHVIVDMIQKAGGAVKETEDGYCFSGGELKPFEADLSGCPDLGPVLFALAAAADGTSVFTGTERLKIKESDRIASMREELAKVGAEVKEEDGKVFVSGPAVFHENVIFEGHNDHRIVMALSVLCALSACPVIMEGAQAVSKSYPGFFEDLEKTGMKVTYDQ
ncbi:MAG: 3-phosphoshikimate 1-carboxyvinyltransferase [Solobacterium sp.]|nr:3-phosphoshikimate 1-carboxyvinyltransferase [Solobacterium sp.]